MTTNSTEKALARHPEITNRPVSVRQLQQRFDSRPASSISALLIKMGPFEAGEDAFRFDNSFGLTAGNARRMREHISNTDMGQIVGALASPYRAALEGLSFDPLGPLGPAIGLPGFFITEVVDQIRGELAARMSDEILGAIPGSYGRCGGMAFAGYDFYLAGWPVDDRLGTTPPDGGELGNYIFERLLDSLDLNIATFLDWWGRVHLWNVMEDVAEGIVLSAAGAMLGGTLGGLLGAAIASQTDLFDFGNPKAVLSDTKKEWETIKSILDLEAAVPIGLIFGNLELLWEQHQVLAIGYSDAGPGNCILRIWDNNEGNKSGELRIDFTGRELKVVNSLSGHQIKGIFHERYTPRRPPLDLKLP